MSGLRAGGIAMRVCNRKGCGADISTAPRNRLYCSDQCRWDCHHAPQLRRGEVRPEALYEATSIRLSCDEWNAVERLSAAAGVSRSAWVRGVVVAALERAKR